MRGINLLLPGDVRASLAVYRGCQARQGSDNDLLASSLEELDGRADLGSHAALGELARGQVGADFRQAHPTQLALVGLPIVDRDACDSGGDDQ